ncbi:MAG: antitoxin VbhA family protein [Agathobacter sp.]|nr:antitoxin VbhA family protein [Agathobacter sp.]
MVVENTKRNQELQNVVATMAIEDMYLSESFVGELMKVDRGEKTTEQLRQEIIRKYAR